MRQTPEIHERKGRGVKPSVALERHRAAIRLASSRYRLANPRVFGSTVRGSDTDESDLDLLVDALPQATLFDLGGLQEELEALLQVRVDLRTPGDLPETVRARARRGQARMTSPRLAEYLEHMLAAAREVLAFVEGQSRETFLADRRTQRPS
jgi:predicted nucleotidyltransferase